jgi:hypothetical protein
MPLNGVAVEDGRWEGTNVMVNVRLLFVCSVGCCFVDEAWRVKLK